MDSLPDVPGWADLEQKLNHSAQSMGNSFSNT
jgi:hypothetical protein